MVNANRQAVVFGMARLWLAGSMWLTTSLADSPRPTRILQREPFPLICPLSTNIGEERPEGSDRPCLSNHEPENASVLDDKDLTNSQPDQTRKNPTSTGSANLPCTNATVALPTKALAPSVVAKTHSTYGFDALPTAVLLAPGPLVLVNDHHEKPTIPQTLPALATPAQDAATSATPPVAPVQTVPTPPIRAVAPVVPTLPIAPLPAAPAPPITLIAPNAPVLPTVPTPPITIVSPTATDENVPAINGAQPAVTISNLEAVRTGQIKVTGKAKIYVKPTSMYLFVTLTSKGRTVQELFKSRQIEADRFKDIVKGLGKGQFQVIYKGQTPNHEFDEDTYKPVKLQTQQVFALKLENLAQYSADETMTLTLNAVDALQDAGYTICHYDASSSVDYSILEVYSALMTSKTEMVFFSYENVKAQRQQALTLAMADARQQAQFLADLTDCSVTGVVDIADESEIIADEVLCWDLLDLPITVSLNVTFEMKSKRP